MTRSTDAVVRYRVAVLTAVLLALFCCGPAVWADPEEPSRADRQITRTVAGHLSKGHLLDRELDDEISERCLGIFLKTLDPWKVYFYQSDIDTFTEHQDELDDMIRNGDVSFAYTVFKVFLQRVDERVALVEEILAGPFDFTSDETMVSDRDLARYPRTYADARDQWRKRIKYELLMLKADDTEGQEALDKLKQRYTSLKRRMHQTDEEELLEMYLTSMSSSFDPHTSYMSPSTLKNFEIAMKLELEGIGASLQSVDGFTVVKKIITGGAADKDGRLHVEDKIVGVGQGEDGEIVDTVDMKLKDVVDLIRGKKGTIVRLEVIPVDDPNREIIDITRAKIELTDSEAQGKVFDCGRKSDGQPYRVGVIDLPSFYMDMDRARAGDPDYKSTTRDVRRILEGFKVGGVDAVILDLRRNGGGSLTEAINCTGLFIDEGPVVQVKDAKGRITPYHDLEPGTVWAGPLIVLTSKFSASASEILAGAIQDYHRGLIVGDHSTHGKGTVQSLMDLGKRLFPVAASPEMGALKITMQQFYRPSGASTQKKGVEADLELPSLTTHLDVSEADLDYPIEFDTVERLAFNPVDQVSQAMCDQLKRASEMRLTQSEDFQRVQKQIARYLEQKERKYVTLNEEKFLKERAELNAEKEEERALEDAANPEMSTIERDYYLDEAMAIMVDYLNLRQVAKVN